MRTGRLILLALVVIGLGAYIGFVERNEPTTDQLKERKDKLFAGLDQAKVDKVVVTNPHGRFELVKQDDAWALKAPLADQANQGAVSSLLFSLAGLKTERTFPAKDVKLAEYGLDKPPLSVTVDEASGKSYTLRLGNELPLGNLRAAETGDGNVYLVSKYVASDLDKDLAAWRSDELAQVYAPDVASVTVANPSGQFTLAHAGSLWTITAPVPDLADRDRAEGLITDISGARIKEFVDNAPDLKALGLDPPRFAVTIVRRNAKAAPIALEFGNERDAKDGKQVACKRGDRVFWVEAKAASRLGGPWQQWRSKRLLGFDAWGVDKLEVASGAGKASLQRTSGLWKSGANEADGDAVSRRITALGDLEVQTFDLPKPPGTPLGSVKLSGQGFSDDVTFYRGSAAGEDVAVVAGRTGALGVEAAKVAAVLADPAALAKPKPTPTPTPAPGSAKPGKAAPANVK